MAPSTTKQWKVAGKNGFDALNFEEGASVPKVGDKDVLVKSEQLLSSSDGKACANMAQSTERP